MYLPTYKLTGYLLCLIRVTCSSPSLKPSTWRDISLNSFTRKGTDVSLGFGYIEILSDNNVHNFAPYLGHLRWYNTNRNDPMRAELPKVTKEGGLVLIRAKSWTFLPLNCANENEPYWMHFVSSGHRKILPYFSPNWSYHHRVTLDINKNLYKNEFLWLKNAWLRHAIYPIISNW